MFLVYSAKRNGTEHGYSTVHCTCSLVHCNVFSNYSFTVLRSALLRETMMGTHLYFPSSNGAERNAFDSDGNIGISLAIQYFPAPLRTRIIATLTVPTERSGALLTVMGTLQFL